MKKSYLAVLLLIPFLFWGQQSKYDSFATNWIHMHLKELGLSEGAVLKLGFSHIGPGGETLRYYQFIGDTKVWDHEVLVHFDLKGELSFYDSTCKIFSNTLINSIKLTNDEAVLIANKANDLGESQIGFQESNLYLFNKNGALMYQYRVITNPLSGVASWEVWVDAETGLTTIPKDNAIYHHNNRSLPKPKLKKLFPFASNMSVSTGTAKIYNPDPLSQTQHAYAGNYSDNNDATNVDLDNARVDVTLPEIDLTSGIYKLKSSFVEIKDFEAPNKGLFTQSTSAFVFTRNQDGFEAVNAFYHLDNSLRYINQTLGITCRPSLNAGVLQFDPSGLSAADNSHYLPSSDQIAFGEGGVDDAEDADVLLHEFGHGIHDWMTNGSSSSAQGLGEGSGDYWAQSYSRSLNQWPSTSDAYQWMFSWDGHNTYWSGRVTNYDAVYPSGLVNSIHTDGQIWATSLMRIWDVIGKMKTDKAFLQGLALTNSSSNQQKAAVAVRQAAIDMNYSCADVKVFTDEFTATGYTMPNIALKINCPIEQTFQADASNSWAYTSFADQTNAISTNCDAVISQNPAAGTIVAPGTYPVTMSAVLGTTTKTCVFNVTVLPDLSINDIQLRQISVFPNPAANELYIKGIPEGTSFELHSVLGQKILTHRSETSNLQLDISSLQSGVYLLNFKELGVAKKFVKK
ncbi:MAG: hypothetical protein CFE24_05560 [Flavobacterium sp. BFFFF2]|nr:MAG: hypothetical protein CFE24_05560 [Flavobacterium sp. BFFFF2]